MIASPMKQNLIIDSDDNSLAEIWNRVARHGELRAIDADSFSVSVQDGVVWLTGHVTTQDHRKFIEAIACSVPSVNTVHNKLVVDSDLTIHVAEKLSKAERTRHFIFPVGCAHGWVRIGGVVPRRELQLAVEEIAAQVPFVRGVLSRPRVVSEYPETERRPVQPPVQAKVYDHNRQEGIVTQVVIQPRNRLVTHAVVSASDFQHGKFVIYEHLVPVEAMEVVNKEDIFLKRNGPPLHTFPAFEPSNFPLAPADWQPPYPYMTNDVRWQCS
jgi:osmotically-inducible protein OsmY